MHGHHVQAIIEVFAKSAQAHRFFQVSVSGGHKTNVDGDGLDAAHTHEFPFLDHPQELGLHRERHVTDFIKKEGAAVGVLQNARFGGGRPGIGVFFMTEKLVCQ